MKNTTALALKTNIAYFRALNGLDINGMADIMQRSRCTYIAKMKNPEKFTIEDINNFASAFNVKPCELLVFMDFTKM